MTCCKKAGCKEATLQLPYLLWCAAEAETADVCWHQVHVLGGNSDEVGVAIVQRLVKLLQGTSVLNGVNTIGLLNSPQTFVGRSVLVNVPKLELQVLPWVCRRYYLVQYTSMVQLRCGDITTISQMCNFQKH